MENHWVIRFGNKENLILEYDKRTIKPVRKVLPTTNRLKPKEQRYMAVTTNTTRVF